MYSRSLKTKDTMGYRYRSAVTLVTLAIDLSRITKIRWWIFGFPHVVKIVGMKVTCFSALVETRVANKSGRTPQLNQTKDKLPFWCFTRPSADTGTD